MDETTSSVRIEIPGENTININTKNKPLVRSCKELSQSQPDLSSGEYRIDPNGGDEQDAILVYCDMLTRATCVHPQLSRNRTYVGEENEIWLSDYLGGQEIGYEATNNQLVHLQMLSTKATQNITYHCQNSIAYYDAENQNYQLALKFFAWDNAELSSSGRKYLRYEVIDDGCQVKRIEYHD